MEKQISVVCQQYIEEVTPFAVYKMLPRSIFADRPYARIKVRHSRPTVIGSLYEQAIQQHFHNKAIVTTTNVDVATDSMIPCQIFFPSGYQYLYIPSVDHTEETFKQSMDVLLATMPIDEALKITIDVLRSSYVASDLKTGIIKSSEIIFYGVSHFYATPFVI